MAVRTGDSTTELPRAVIARELGPVANYTLVPNDPGPAGPDQIRLAVRAAGISYVDVLVSRGDYQIKPPTPFIPGSEFAGIVESVGEGVTHLAPGDRVMASAFGIAFSEAAVLPAKLARKIPDQMSFTEAACFRVSYATAYHALVQQGRLAKNEKVLVLGAGGAVGVATIQVAKALGAFVIGSASTPEKRTLALAAGADTVVEARAENWREQVAQACVGGKTDIVVDPVGGEATELAFRTLAWDGRHLVIGFVAGIARLPTNLALLKGAHLIGVDVRQFGEKFPEVAETNMQDLFALYEQGKLKPHITSRYPIERFAEAMNEAFSGKTAGRVVLEMGGNDSAQN
jgi:NADPH2:quinone reductase